MAAVESLKKKLPWPLKIGAKLVLARVPVSPTTWRRLSVFKHGRMDDPSYAWEVFNRHVGCDRRGQREGFVSLELGPGDTVSSAMIAAALGGGTTFLVDVAQFAIRDLEPYRRLAAFLSERGLDAPDVSAVGTFDELLERCRAVYLTDGISSLRSLQEGSVDVVWSHATLEHVRRHAVEATLRETRRILRSDGYASHQIDLRDHLADALNNLRFSAKLWESPLMSSSGFYTNRLRCSEWLEAFARAGFLVESTVTERWPTLPTPRHKLAAPFRAMPDDDLLVADVQALLRPA
jgi:SAM-dependent methyltransferase